MEEYKYIGRIDNIKNLLDRIKELNSYLKNDSYSKEELWNEICRISQIKINYKDIYENYNKVKDSIFEIIEEFDKSLEKLKYYIDNLDYKLFSIEYIEGNIDGFIDNFYDNIRFMGRPFHSEVRYGKEILRKIYFLFDKYKKIIRKKYCNEENRIKLDNFLDYLSLYSILKIKKYEILEEILEFYFHKEDREKYKYIFYSIFKPFFDNYEGKHIIDEYFKSSFEYYYSKDIGIRKFVWFGIYKLAKDFRDEFYSYSCNLLYKNILPFIRKKSNKLEKTPINILC